MKNLAKILLALMLGAAVLFSTVACSVSVNTPETEDDEKDDEKDKEDEGKEDEGKEDEGKEGEGKEGEDGNNDEKPEEPENPEEPEEPALTEDEIIEAATLAAQNYFYAICVNDDYEEASLYTTEPGEYEGFGGRNFAEVMENAGNTYESLYESAYEMFESNLVDVPEALLEGLSDVKATRDAELIVAAFEKGLDADFIDAELVSEDEVLVNVEFYLPEITAENDVESVFVSVTEEISEEMENGDISEDISVDELVPIFVERFDDKLIDYYNEILETSVDTASAVLPCTVVCVDGEWLVSDIDGAGPQLPLLGDF